MAKTFHIHCIERINMHILGLYEVNLAEIERHIEKESTVLPYFARISLPEDKELYPNRTKIEETIKIAAVEIAYLVINQNRLQHEYEKLKTAAKDAPRYKDTLDTYDLQIKYIGSLIDQSCVELYKYCYFNIVRPHLESENKADQTRASELSTIVQEPTIEEGGEKKKQKLLVPSIDPKMHAFFQGKKVIPQVQGDGFSKLAGKMKEFIIYKKFQSEKLDLPKDERLYLKDFLRGEEKESKQRPSA